MVRWSCSRPRPHPFPFNFSLPPLPLRVEAGLIVDGSGSRFPLHGVNWAGFHIKHAASGLDRAPLDSIAVLIRRLGFNLVRLPWSVQMVLTNPLVGEEWVAANPRLKGLRALSLYDEVVAALGRAGVLVWSDNHISDSDWCCGERDCNGLWFNERWSLEQWAEAHRRIARRYRHVPAVVGLGLRNEPRSACGGGPAVATRGTCNASFYDAKLDPLSCAEVHWSSGPKERRWREAAEYAGAGVLAENPHLLVSVGGIDYANDLTGVALDPVRLPASNIVYEAHEYIWFKWSYHPGMTLRADIEAPGVMDKDEAQDACLALGHACAGITCTLDRSSCSLSSSAALTATAHGEVSFLRKYNVSTFDGFHASLDHFWGNVVRDRVAPVFVSEYGFPHNWLTDPNYPGWFAAWAQYVRGVAGPLGSELGGLDWSYWELSGEQMGGTGRTPGATEDFGILNHCWNAPADASHTAAVQSLMPLPPMGRAAAERPLGTEALPSAPGTPGLESAQGAAGAAWAWVAVAAAALLVGLLARAHRRRSESAAAAASVALLGS